MSEIFWHTCGTCGERVRMRDTGWQHLSRRSDHPVEDVVAHRESPLRLVTG